VPSIDMALPSTEKPPVHPRHSPSGSVCQVNISGASVILAAAGLTGGHGPPSPAGSVGKWPLPPAVAGLSTSPGA
jgi:hypothetical protein